MRTAFATGSFEKSLNHSLIALTPKEANPNGTSQFRPIALSKVSVKILSKVLANRLKGNMSKLVGVNQRSFIPGRQAVDNVVLAQEKIHSMRGKKRKKRYLAVKMI